MTCRRVERLGITLLFNIIAGNQSGPPEKGATGALPVAGRRPSPAEGRLKIDIPA